MDNGPANGVLGSEGEIASRGGGGGGRPPECGEGWISTGGPQSLEYSHFLNLLRLYADILQVSGSDVLDLRVVCCLGVHMPSFPHRGRRSAAWRMKPTPRA